MVSPELSASPAQLGFAAKLRVGEAVYAVGSPRGLELSLSDGIVSQLRDDKSAPLIQTTVPISPGSSGGGLFDSQGRLVGITTLYLKESQNLNFAVPVEWLGQLKTQKNLSLTGSLPTPKPKIVDPVTAAPASESGVPASWLLIGNVDGVKIYIKTNTVQRVNGNVRVWQIMDFSKPKYNKQMEYYFQSVSMLDSFDCETRSSALLAYAEHAEGMGMGKVLFSFDVKPSEVASYSVKLGSIDKASLDSVCALAK